MKVKPLPLLMEKNLIQENYKRIFDIYCKTARHSGYTKLTEQSPQKKFIIYSKTLTALQAVSPGSKSPRLDCRIHQSTGQQSSVCVLSTYLSISLVPFPFGNSLKGMALTKVFITGKYQCCFLAFYASPLIGSRQRVTLVSAEIKEQMLKLQQLYLSIYK